MRLSFTIWLALVACSDPKPKRGEGADLGAYLPANPDLVVRIDLERARAWPKLPLVATPALAPVAEITQFVQRTCGFDPLAEAKTVLVAKHGDWRTGDVTIVATGLGRLAGCRAKLAPPFDGEYRVTLGGAVVASGKTIDDKLVIMQRAGKPVDAAVWSELAKQPVSPAWWSQLDQAAPIAARAQTEPRIVTATIEPGDPVIARARLTSASAEAVKRDEQVANAIAQYFQSAQAGTVKAAVAGNSVKLDLDAKGPEVDRLIELGLAALLGTANTGAPVACPALDGAVEQYLAGTVTKATESARPELEARARSLVPLLRKVFVDSCTTGKWSQQAITSRRRPRPRCRGSSTVASCSRPSRSRRSMPRRSRR